MMRMKDNQPLFGWVKSQDADIAVNFGWVKSQDADIAVNSFSYED